MAFRAMTQGDLIIRLFLAIFGSLFYLDQLSTCHYRLDLWVASWWTGVFLSIVLIAWDSLRYRLGYKLGILIFWASILFNISGVYMFWSSYTHSYECIPPRIDTPLLIFFAGTSMGVVAASVGFFYFGMPSVVALFVDEQVMKNIVEMVKSGEVEVERYLQQRKDVDNCALFEFERLLIHEIGEVEGVQTHEAKPMCGLCGEDLIKEEKKMTAFPECTHIFHKDCLEGWFEKNVECPYCKVGGRSGLYRTIAPEKPQVPVKNDKPEDKKNK